MRTRLLPIFVFSALSSNAFAQTAPPPPPPPPSPAPLASLSSKFSATLYGFVELDTIADSTQSFNDLAGNATVARPGSYAADHSRLMFGARNSRIGIKVSGPSTETIKSSAMLEMDFLGNQPPNASEGAFFTNPTFRFRHLNLKLETPVVDILFGQYWQLFGWQSYFHPATVEIQGVPGQIYSRAPQIRFSHAFKSDPVTVEVAVAASRPPQRDSVTPDGQGGIRIMFNKWKGLHTMGSAGTAIDAAAIGVSGTVRRFDLPEFAAKPVNDVSATGAGISIDALVPIVPASAQHKANALTLTGSYVTGTGIADLYTGLTGGIGFPALPNPMMTTPAPTYTPDVDNGLVTFNMEGQLKTVDWRSFIVGAQYYLPPSGNLFVTGNYSQMHSGNIAALGNPAAVFKDSQWADGNLFWDVNSAVRLGLEYAWFNQTYGDGKDATDHRVQFSAFFIF